MATFTIQRSVATFGDAVVYWELAADTNDIIPNNGSVIFTEGVNTGSFQISSQSDLVCMTLIFGRHGNISFFRLLKKTLHIQCSWSQ